MCWKLKSAVMITTYQLLEHAFHNPTAGASNNAHMPKSNLTISQVAGRASFQNPVTHSNERERGGRGERVGVCKAAVGLSAAMTWGTKTLLCVGYMGAIDRPNHQQRPLVPGTNRAPAPTKAGMVIAQ
jgi:hypothetical protein